MMRILGVILLIWVGCLWSQEVESSNVFISAEGLGKAPEGASGPQKKLLAKRASQVVAMKNLKDALLKQSGLNEQEFSGIEKLMTFYDVEGPTVLENGDARTTISLSKRQVLLHYVSLYKELQNREKEIQEFQNRTLELQQLQAEQQKCIELLEQEKKALTLEKDQRIHALEEELLLEKKRSHSNTKVKTEGDSLQEVLKELKNLKKDLGELRTEVFRLQTMENSGIEDEIDFK